MPFPERSATHLTTETQVQSRCHKVVTFIPYAASYFKSIIIMETLRMREIILDSEEDIHEFDSGFY